MLLPQGDEQRIGGGGVAAKITIGAMVALERLRGGKGGGAVGGEWGFRLHGGLSLQVGGGYQPNNSECEPSRAKCNSCSRIAYINSKSGLIWHSR